MKIVVFGATGKTGSCLVEQALDKGHTVVAYIRSASNALPQHTGLKIVVGKLNDSDKLKEAIAGAEVCFSTLGGNSLTKRSPELVAGFKRIVTIAQQEGVMRFIYLSSIGAGESRNFMSSVPRFIVTDVLLRVPLADHNANEQTLQASKLEWTIVRPGSLTNGPKTERWQHGSEKISIKGNPKISRANVACFMLEQAEKIQNIQKSVWLYE
jgi:putative NADH-flavin reductase